MARRKFRSRTRSRPREQSPCDCNPDVRPASAGELCDNDESNHGESRVYPDHVLVAAELDHAVVRPHQMNCCKYGLAGAWLSAPELRDHAPYQHHSITEIVSGVRLLAANNQRCQEMNR